jgi:hypothetical protein
MAVSLPNAGDRRQQLEERLFQCEMRIFEAERRIEDHQRRVIAADGPQRSAHLQLERSLRDGLELLYFYRALHLRELHGSMISPSPFANTQSPQDALGEEAAARRAQLMETIAWLDELSQTTQLGEVIIGQRERAARELWEIQKRWLRQVGQHPSRPGIRMGLGAKMGSAMSRQHKLDELAQAEQHIIQFKRRISDQEGLILELERDGHSTGQARLLLAEFAESLRLALQHREILLQELESLDPANASAQGDERSA